MRLIVGFIDLILNLISIYMNNHRPTTLLFSKVRTAAKELRTNNKKADGLAFWKPIKESLEPFDSITGEWNPILFKHKYEVFYKKIMKLHEKDSNGNMIEPHHFIIQCVRIPRTEILNLRKLIQIALNIGQLMPMLDELPKSIVKEFKELKMHLIGTYIKDTRVFDTASSSRI